MASYLGGLSGFLSFAITAGGANTTRRGSAPRPELLSGPWSLLLPTTPH